MNIESLYVNNFRIDGMSKINLIVGDSGLSLLRIIRDTIVHTDSLKMRMPVCVIDIRSLKTIDFLGQAHQPTLSLLAKLVTTVSNAINYSKDNSQFGTIQSLVHQMIKAQHGVLLVDGIDIGFHFSVMKKLWRFIIETAKQLDVQVFATTHSRDCYKGLANVIQEDDLCDVTVCVIRLEKGEKTPVTFDAQELVIAVDRGIEIR